MKRKPEEYSEATRKRLATCAELGPRLGRSPATKSRIYTDVQVVRAPNQRRNRLPRDTGG